MARNAFDWTQHVRIACGANIDGGGAGESVRENGWAFAAAASAESAQASGADAGRDVSGAAAQTAAAKRVDFVDMLRGAGLLLAGCAAATLLFSALGCTPSGASDAAGTTTAEVLEENATEQDDSTEYASFEDVAAAFDASSLDTDYSKRDMDASYDASGATKIALLGASANVSGSGASVDGSTVIISAAGTYIVSGELSDGSVVVAAGEDDKVQLVLDGATIACSAGAAIDVQSADKCFITLADGTTSALSDAAEHSDDTNACVYAACDLTINGSGSLSVSGNCRHGVFSKDDLVVYGGDIDVTAVEDGLHGKDSVKIGDGDISIEAGGDGVKSTKDDKPTKGFVYVSGGTLSIDAEDDGIQAKTYLEVAGGTVDVEAADDALHSDLEGALNGGDTTVSCGDDAFHCETKLEVNDGSFTAETCCEGYEAEQVIVNGGDTYICATDDALNASAADLSDDSSDDASDDLEEGSTMNGEPGANAVQPDGTIGGSSSTEDPSAAQANDGQQNDGAPSEPPSGGAGQAGQAGATAGAAPGDMGGGQAPDAGGAMGGQAPDGGNGAGDAPGASDSNCLIQINGGTVVLDAQGDGVDSNGNVEITGGTLLVNGPSSDGDGAFDYDGEATISGGTVIMAGSTGMAQSFTSGTQAFAMVQVSGTAGSEIELSDVNGTVLATLTATKSFGCVLVSGAGIADGDTVTVSVNGKASTATASTTGTSGIAMGGGMAPGGMGGGSAMGGQSGQGVSAK